MHWANWGEPTRRRTLMSDYLVPTQVLTQPQEFDSRDEIEVKESAWWRLEPGQAGYELPVWSYCGMTREQWELRKLRRGWR